MKNVQDEYNTIKHPKKIKNTQVEKHKQWAYKTVKCPDIQILTPSWHAAYTIEKKLK